MSDPRHEEGSRPPRIPTRLIEWVVTDVHSRVGILGDLAEEYAERSSRDGRTRAGIQYWSASFQIAVRFFLSNPDRRNGGGRTGLLDGDGVRAARLLLRRTWRSPSTSVAVVGTVALGVAALTLSVRAAYPVLIAPLPFPAPERLVDVHETTVGRDRPVAAANYLDWRREARSFRELAAYAGGTGTLVLSDGGHRIATATVSGNFFHTLGAEAALGRTFDPTLRFGGERVGVLSHGLWVDRFGADPDVIGRTIRIDDLVVRVIGVLGSDLRFAPEPAELWLRSPDEAPELRGFPGDLSTLRDAWYFRVVGRLAPDISIEAAQSEMDGIAQGLAAEFPDSNGDSGVRLRPLGEVIVANQGSVLRLILAASILVVILAIVNVSHILLTRAWDGSADRAVRQALGATRGRLVRNTVGEALLLVSLGGGAGAAIAAISPGGGVGPTEWSVALGAIPLVTILAAILPVLLVGRTPHRFAPIGRGGTGGHLRTRWGFVAVEAALALALLTGSSLLLRSLASAARIDPGFVAEGLWTAKIAFPEARTRSFDERVQRFESLQNRLVAIPGVRTATVASNGPFDLGPSATIRIPGRDLSNIPPDGTLDMGWKPVLPGFHTAMGTTLLHGREIRESDRSDVADVVVLNEEAAEAAFPEEDPLGRMVTIGLDGHDRPLTVVGVVASARNRGPTEPPGPVLYRPLRQADRFAGGTVFLAIRMEDGVPPLAAESVRSILAAISPEAALYDLATGPERVIRETRDLRAMVGVLGAFGVVALVLGGVGVYGVGSFAVRAGRKEIGIRMALGAAPGRTVRVILAQGFAATGIGLLMGVPLALVLTRSLRTLLIGVTPGDPWSWGLSPAVLLVAVALALLPATVSAARTDPVRALRD